MKKIIVEITGTTPLLMHNPAAMRGATGGIKQIPLPVDEAAAARYLMPGSATELALKADHIHSALKIAGRGFRVRGKESVGPYLAGSIEVLPEWISLRTDKYEVDTRRAVVNKQGVLRSRPLIWPWSAVFELHYDETVFAEKFLDEVLRDQIFKRAGTAVGILEYRPSKGGKFGRFEITRWER